MGIDTKFDFAKAAARVFWCRILLDLKQRILYLAKKPWELKRQKNFEQQTIRALAIFVEGRSESWVSKSKVRLMPKTIARL